MGRIEKKFQKRKDRERAVRKKILKKREASHVLAKQIEEQNRLEREVNKAERKFNKQPIRNASPELKKALEAVEKLTDNAFAKEDNPDIDRSDDPQPRIKGKSKWIDSTEGFAPNLCCGGPPAEELGK
jgi:hypothetical protein